MNNEEKNRVMAERKRQRAKLAQMSNVVDPVVKVKFQNLEDPPAPGKPSPPFEFCYQTPKGVILTFKISRTEEMPDTALRHGQIYELPLSVVNHLNNVQSPVWGQKHVKDPVTGGLRIINYISGYRNRFACTPVDMTNYEVVDQGEKKKGPGRPSKKDEQSKTNEDLGKLATA